MNISPIVLKSIIVEELTRAALDSFVKQVSNSHADKWAKALGDEVGFSDMIKGALQKGDLSPEDLSSVINQAVAEAGLQTLQDSEMKAREIAHKNVATTDDDIVSMQKNNDPSYIVSDPLFKGEKPRIAKV